MNFYQNNAAMTGGYATVLLPFPLPRVQFKDQQKRVPRGVQTLSTAPCSIMRGLAHQTGLSNQKKGN